MNTHPASTLFAVVGDVHGHMHAMVKLLTAWERQSGEPLAFVLQTGDFQPTRDACDLASLPAPAKYRLMGDFADFHDERARFPWPVYFIGGNHEPFSFLESMPSGGTVTHNCRYLGSAGRKELHGLRLAWLSGIAPPEDASRKTHRRDWKSKAYFTQEDLNQVLSAEAVDLLLLHEWPLGVATPEQAAGQRRSGGADGPGNSEARALVDLLKPRFVCAGHMHWPHRSSLSAGTQFIGLGHIDRGRDALAVFRIQPSGVLAEIVEERGSVP